MMLETAEAFCRDKSPIAYVRDRLGPSTSFDDALWQDMAQLGWLGLTIPEEYGGVGLGLAEAVTVQEPLGRTLIGLPFMNTTIVASAISHAGSEEQKTRSLKYER